MAGKSKTRPHLPRLVGRYLTDRGPKLCDAVRHVERIGADKFPLRIVAIHHDGPGPPLAKQKKKKMDLEE